MFLLLLATKQDTFEKRGYFPDGLLATKPDMLDEKSGHFLSGVFATRLDILFFFFFSDLDQIILFLNFFFFFMKLGKRQGDMGDKYIIPR